MIFRIKAVFLVLLTIAIGLPACRQSDDQDIQDFAERLYAAQQAKEVPPQASAQLAGLDARQAYRVQKALVDRHLADRETAGFKAGLTTPAAQERFQVDQPVAGVLFTAGQKVPGDTVFFADYNRMTVETELGYFLNREIDRPVASVEELKGYVNLVLPVLEFPNAAFGESPSVYDIISANAGSAYFITGPTSELLNLDVNNLGVTLHRDSTLMNSGSGADTMGDQWETLRWLINRMVEQGYVIRPQDLLITGALGNAFPAEAGAYTADYGNLGRVDFYIK